MTSILTVVCIQSSGEPALPTQPFVIEETVHDAQHAPRIFAYHAVGSLIIEDAVQIPMHAGYLGGLTRYFGQPVEGKAYYVSVDTGDRYHTGEPFLASEAFFPLPASDEEPVLLRIGDEYRDAFTIILKALLRSSRAQRVLILSEYNGYVTSMHERMPEEEAVDPIHIYGPMSVEEFWEAHDAGNIAQQSITIIQGS